MNVKARYRFEKSPIDTFPTVEKVQSTDSNSTTFCCRLIVIVTFRVSTDSNSKNRLSTDSNSKIRLSTDSNSKIRLSTDSNSKILLSTDSNSKTLLLTDSNYRLKS